MSSTEPACLVLTCNRPYYVERRKANYATFKLIADAGFTITFLLADPTLSKPAKTKDLDTGYDILTVPCPESYDYLSLKMQLAFSALRGVAGVLKIDDDIRIPDPSCLQELRTIITDTDYFGIAPIYIKEGAKVKLRYGDSKKFSPLFNHLETMSMKDFVYFGGPFYWISDKVLTKFEDDTLEYPWEDLAVGYLVSNYPELKVKHLPWKKRVTWPNDTEPIYTPPEKICSLSVSGRLGNHMFQVAALLRHCLVHNKKIELSVNNNSGYYDGPLYRCKQFITPTVVHNNAGAPPFHYIPIDTDARVLHGYFQSSKYFSDISGHIRELFDPHPVIKSVTAAKYGSLIQENTVVIHVRRGDYVSGANLRIHGILTPLYYRAAMARFRELLGPDCKFLLFSDDSKYCEATYKDDAGITVINEPNEAVSLHFMSQFRHYIIANSSFSWWATYLGLQGGTVIAPDPWFGPGGPQDFQDIYEDGWIRLLAQ